MSKVLIIGGMAAGCKTAARLKRNKPEFEITIIERLPILSFGACGMPFFASGDIDSFDELRQTPWGALRDSEFFESVKGVTAIVNTEVLELKHSERIAICKNTQTGETLELSYDYLVFTTGASPSIPNIEYEPADNILTFHNPFDAKKCRQLAQKGLLESAIIVGGGYIGCELAEALAGLWGIDTTLVEAENRLLPRSLDREVSSLLEKNFSNNSVQLKLGAKVVGIESSDGMATVHFSDGTKAEATHVFLCPGVKPNSALAKSIGVETGNFGGILVDEQMRTNIPGVWAAGDCVETKHHVTGKYSFFPLGSLANRMGRVVADSIAGIDGSKFQGACGAVSTKIFGLTIATAGLNINEAHKCGSDAKAVWGSWQDRPDYMPESKSLFGSLVYDKQSYKLLGLQLAGAGEVTRYIDTFSSLLAHGATLYDLLETEHAYTPPHSSPMNPLNFLGAMALESERTGLECLSPLMLGEYAGIALDVREDEEIQAAPLQRGAIAIPLAEIRKNISTLNIEKTYLVVCQRGPRSYEAARILRNSGIKNVVYLGGGASFALGMLDEVDN